MTGRLNHNGHLVVRKMQKFRRHTPPRVTRPHHTKASIRAASRRLPLRTVHSPTCPAGIRRNLSDSAGIRWTQLPDFVSVTRAKLAYLVREESGGVRWSLPEYGIIQWSLWIPTILFRWIPVD